MQLAKVFGGPHSARKRSEQQVTIYDEVIEQIQRFREAFLAVPEDPPETRAQPEPDEPPKIS